MFFPQKKKIESELPKLFNERYSKIVHLISSEKPDLLAIQEFWASKNGTEELLRKSLGDYEFFVLQRTSNRFASLLSKRFILYQPLIFAFKRPDGLAILLRKERFQMVAQDYVRFNDVGDRVSINLLLKDRKYADKYLCVSNVHLTFPHNNFDEFTLRLHQTKITLNSVKQFQQKHGIQCPIILCGDLNCNNIEDDVVLRELGENGFKNVYFEMNPEKKTFCSHKSHTQVDVPADHMLFLDPLDSIQPFFSKFFPYDVDDKAWPSNFKMSDHRPLVSKFNWK